MPYMNIYTYIYMSMYMPCMSIYEHIYKYMALNYIVYVWNLIPNKCLMKRVAIVIILHHGKGKREISLGQRVM